jgi:hypothetical protein
MHHCATPSSAPKPSTSGLYPTDYHQITINAETAKPRSQLSGNRYLSRGAQVVVRI